MQLLCGYMAMNGLERAGNRHNVFLVSVHFCMIERFYHTHAHKIKCANKNRVWALDSNCLSLT